MGLTLEFLVGEDRKVIKGLLISILIFLMKKMSLLKEEGFSYNSY